MQDSMDENRVGIGHLLSGLGALVALVSLWLPWLRLDLDKVRQEPAFKAALDAGGVSQQIQADIYRFISQLPPKINGNGWQVMEKTDIAFALAAAAVIALVFATVALGADSRGTAKIMIFVGLGGTAVVLFKMSSPGIPSEATDFVSRGPGFMVALVGWTICAAGGIVAVMNPPASAAEPVAPAQYVPVTSPAAVEPTPTPTPAVPEPEPEPAAPLTPEYTPDPAAATTSVAPPPRS
jgi:hypothetical protein